jgi:hypothetical protein
MSDLQQPVMKFGEMPTRSVPPMNAHSKALLEKMRGLADTDEPLFPETHLLLEMAVDAQMGKPIDLSKISTTENYVHPIS